MTGSLTTVVLAAGEGTRMRSKTPKMLHPLAGRPLVEHAIRAAAGVDPEHLMVVVGHAREAVSQHLEQVSKTLGRDILTAVQEVQKGTGHAVACGLTGLPANLTGSILVINGDVPLLDSKTLSSLLEVHHAQHNAVTVLSASVEDPTGYGRIVRDQSGTVEAIVEQKDANAAQKAIQEINSGVYVFDAEVLADGLSRLSTDNAQGELYLTDVLGIARQDGKRVDAFSIDDVWLTEGVNDRVQLATLAAEMNRRIVRRWQLAGVTVLDPATTWIEASVELAADVTIEPNVQLRGETTVAEDALIGPDCTLTNVTVGTGAQVIRTHANEAKIGEHATVGPFAYLRPGTRLGAKGKIGTFVETKNAEIGTGSKVPHLTYVGDATIGEYSNIGASSVFVNYDGVNKHHTTIGSQVRTGSDNMFVAPVTVGDGAYSGAGTVIRRDVPPGALAVSGGLQRNLEGWVLNRRPGTAAALAAEQALASDKESEEETSNIQ